MRKGRSMALNDFLSVGCDFALFPMMPCNTYIGSTITDVSNQVENNGGLGQPTKQRTSSGGKEDTENSSVGSPMETFEGFDS